MSSGGGEYQQGQLPRVLSPHIAVDSRNWSSQSAEESRAPSTLQILKVNHSPESGGDMMQSNLSEEQKPLPDKDNKFTQPVNTTVSASLSSLVDKMQGCSQSPVTAGSMEMNTACGSNNPVVTMNAMAMALELKPSDNSSAANNHDANNIANNNTNRNNLATTDQSTDAKSSTTKPKRCNS